MPDQVRFTNEQIQEVYDKCLAVFDDPKQDAQTRIKYYEKTQILIAVYHAYERGVELDEEFLNDLFIDYRLGGHMPVFKEDTAPEFDLNKSPERNLYQRMEERLKAGKWKRSINRNTKYKSCW